MKQITEMVGPEGVFISGAALTLIVNAVLKYFLSRNQKTTVLPSPLVTRLAQDFTPLDTFNAFRRESLDAHGEIVGRVTKLEVGHSADKAKLEGVDRVVEIIQTDISEIKATMNAILTKLP